MQMSRFRIPVIAVAAMAVVGATPADKAASAQPYTAIDTAATVTATVVVHNDNWQDVEVVALTDAGKRFRLGEVARGLERSFSFPDALVDGKCQFRLKVYSIDNQVGSLLATRYLGAVQTKPLSVSAGSEIVMHITDPLGESFIAPTP